MEYFFIGVLGLVIGSFLNVCIYRIPEEQSISYPPSHCGSCNHQLKILDLVPVFSYIFLKGRCRYCGNKISIQYPAIELLNGVMYIILYFLYGATIDFIKYAVFASLMIVIGMIDAKTQFVYRSTIIFGTISGVIFILINKFLLDEHILTFIYGGIFGAVVIGFVVLITRGRGMGAGDIEIAAITGIFLGLKLNILGLFLGIVIGGIYGAILLMFFKKKGNQEIAFGPFIAIGAMISVFMGVNIINWYMTMFL